MPTADDARAMSGRGSTRTARDVVPGVHLVVHGVLGKGASSNGRPDIAGKAVAEFLRARHVDVPVALLAEVGHAGAGA